MKALGVNAKPESVVGMDNSAVVTMRSESTYKTIKVTFKLNEVFGQMTACVTFVATAVLKKKRPAGTKSIIENEME